MYKVLEKLQEMGNKMWTSAQGNKNEKETSIYSGGTNTSTKTKMGEPVNDWNAGARCY